MSGDARTVLVVDDDPDLGFLVGDLLRRNGFRTVVESSGRGGLRAAFEHRPELVILDLGLPDLDGLEVLERLRELTDVPVMLLTARDREPDKVDGLGRGADDYLTKPFGNAELVARVHALLRRSPGARQDRPTAYRDERLTMDFTTHTVTCDGRQVELTPTDWRLLSVLVRHRGQVLTHDELLELAWHDPRTVGPSRVKYAVLRLRQRLGWDDVRTSPIQAVRGFGYRYTAPGR
jgi:DNA-binding response OmpR family regulator